MKSHCEVYTILKYHTENFAWCFSSMCTKVAILLDSEDFEVDPIKFFKNYRLCVEKK